MGQFALRNQDTQPQTAPALRLVIGGKYNAAIAASVTHSIPTEILALGAILAILQILDGVLTGIGVYQYGTTMEGNILLRSLMSAIGYIPALLLVKGGSIGLIALLCTQATTISWLKHAFYGVTALYVVGAVLPWTYILLTDYLA